MKTTIRLVSVVGSCVALGAASLIQGCASTYQTRGAATPSVFLGDTSQLREGTGAEAKLVYINPKADFRKYTKIQLAPVVLIAENAKSSAFSAMSKEDQQAVVNYVDAQIREKLKGSYAFVTAAGPDVMSLRVAVTEAQGSAVVMDTVSTLMPIGLAVSTVKRVATGTHSSVGKAGVEMELKDSVTGVRLAAGVDERAGRKITLLGDKFNRYHTVEDAFDFWTTRLQERLAQLRGGK